ncbi:MAG: septum site-determining protein MinD [Oscillospiraceae bacterium]|nr:septum site-determining protein MinD [Oscillospiraceae bacterium]
MGTAIVVTSGKGGTGKTTVTSAVSSCLAALGSRVLCVDMDIGLRNLDLSLGMSDRAVMDFTDVIQGRCPLKRAAAAQPDIPGLFLLTAPVRLPPEGIAPRQMAEFLTQARQEFDYILMDSPAGLGAGFRLACAGADRAVVVATNDPSALRDAQRTVHELSRAVPQIHLVMNRVQPKLLRRLHTTIDDAMDAAGLPLLGVIPDDPRVAVALGAGRPLVLTTSRGAAVACLNIAKRLRGQRVSLMKLR